MVTLSPAHAYRFLILLACSLSLASCGGGGSGGNGLPQNDPVQGEQISITGVTAVGGQIDPPITTILLDASASVELIPDPGYSVGTVSGCPGSVSGQTYTTEPLSNDCMLIAEFVRTGAPIFVDIFGMGDVESDADQCTCLLYTSPSPRDKRQSRMPSSA